MRLQFGSYQFDANATLVSPSIVTLVNHGGQAYAQKKSFHVSGYLSGNGEAALTQAENALKSALAKPYQDLLLLTSAGGQSSEILTNAGSISGVLVMDAKFPTTATSPEYATIRTFEFTAVAEYPLPGTSNYLLSFQETLTFWGGNPLYVHRNAINGKPQKQMVYPYTTYHATQSGSAVGYNKRPTQPQPKWPGALKANPKISVKNPTRKGKGYEGYEITWEYQFEDAGPLFGQPNIWIS